MAINAVDSPASVAPVGELLRSWRSARRVSQLDLALEAGVSARHLSYVETGKSQASREMIVRLAEALEMPLRECNVLLGAAGYAPIFPESAVGAPALAPMRRAIDLILQHQEPYPAFLLDRRWDMVATNRAATRVVNYLRGGSAHTNMLRQFFDPNDLRACVVNWEEIARDLMRHLHDVVAAAPSDAKARALLDEVLSYPDVPSQWRVRELGATPTPLLTVVFRKGSQELRFFSTIATFGAPHDVTLEELRVECAFPADDPTAELCKTLASNDQAGSASAG
jgi:transcriptional regulator with XRE-family HTH domain